MDSPRTSDGNLIYFLCFVSLFTTPHEKTIFSKYELL